MYSAYKLNKQGPQNGVSHPNPGGVVRSFIVKGRVADTEWVCAGPSRLQSRDRLESGDDGALWPSLKWRVSYQVVNIFHLVGLSSAEELKDIALCVSWESTRTLPQGCTNVSCLCVPSLPWLTAVWICPLELKEVHGGWMKPVSCNQERFLCPGAPSSPAPFQDHIKILNAMSQRPNLTVFWSSH